MVLCVVVMLILYGTSELVLRTCPVKTDYGGGWWLLASRNPVPSQSPVWRLAQRLLGVPGFVSGTARGLTLAPPHPSQKHGWKQRLHPVHAVTDSCRQTTAPLLGS
jgi:hypothetical protein